MTVPPDHVSTLAWNLRQQRNLNFAGRERVLSALASAYASGRPETRVQVLQGSTGIGKTQLATEFAYRHREEHAVTWWVRAYDPVTLQADYAALADALGIATGAAPAAAICRMVADRLASSDGTWLLIFDGADTPAAVTPYLPSRGGRILITTRSAKWADVAPPAATFALRVLERAEAVDLLQRRSGRADEWPVSGATVAQALGDHPLAITQAAATIEQAGITFGDYLSRFEQYWAELLRSGRSSGDYPDVVAMTWELACRAVDEAEPEVTALLKLCAFFAPVEVPRTLIADIAYKAPLPLSHFRTAAALEAAIRSLHRYGLVEATEHGMIVHPLTASLSRDRLPEDWRRNWCKSAIDLVLAAFPFDPDIASSWRQTAAVAPHAVAVTEHAVAMNVDAGATGKLLNVLGSWLYETGAYARARGVLERSLELTTHAHGERNPRRSAVVANLAKVLKRQGEVRAARGHLEEAMRTDAAAYGENHPHVAELANNLGTVLHRTGDVQAAREHFAWALEVIQNRYGAEHPDVASLTNNLGYSVASLGDVAKAIEHFETALATAEASYGSDHPVVAHITANLGIAKRIRGDADEAERLFERAIRIARRALGVDHSDVARILTHAALLDLDRGNPTAAADRLRQAIQIDERALGPWHVGHITKLNYLSRCLKQMDDIDGAVACHDRCAAILRHLRTAQVSEVQAPSLG